MNTKLETYTSIVKINAKQLINAMETAKMDNDPTNLAFTILDEIVPNLIDFNIPNNPLIGDITNNFDMTDKLMELGDLYDNGTYNDDDFVPTEFINELCPSMQIDYMHSLFHECIEKFDEWVKNGTLSLHSSNSLLITIFGEYTTKKYILTDKSLLADIKYLK